MCGRNWGMELGNASGNTSARLETPQVRASVYHDPVAPLLLVGQRVEQRALVTVLGAVRTAIALLLPLVQERRNAQSRRLCLSPATISEGWVEWSG